MYKLVYEIIRLKKWHFLRYVMRKEKIETQIIVKPTNCMLSHYKRRLFLLAIKV